MILVNIIFALSNVYASVNLDNWYLSDQVKSEDNHSSVSFLTRYMQSGNITYPIGHITYSEHVVIDNEDISVVTDTVKAAYANLDWIESKKDDGTIELKTYWSLINRLVNYKIKKQGNKVITAVAVYRVGYSYFLNEEIEYMQAGLMKDADEKVAKKLSFLNMFPRLHAALLSPEDLGGFLRDNFPGITPDQIGDILDKFPITDGLIDINIGNLEEIKKLLEIAGEIPAKTIKDLNDLLNRAENGVYGTAAKALGQLTDPKHMALVGAATAFGMQFGTVLFDVSAKIFQDWIAKVSGTKAHIAFHDKYLPEATAKFSELLNNITIAETQLDKYINLIRQFENENITSAEGFRKIVQKQTALQSGFSDLEERKYTEAKEMAWGTPAYWECKSEEAGVTMEVDKLDPITKFLTDVYNHGYPSASGQTGLCREIESLLEKIAVWESTIDGLLTDLKRGLAVDSNELKKREGNDRWVSSRNAKAGDPELKPLKEFLNKCKKDPKSCSEVLVRTTEEAIKAAEAAGDPDVDFSIIRESFANKALIINNLIICAGNRRDQDCKDIEGVISESKKDEVRALCGLPISGHYKGTAERLFGDQSKSEKPNIPQAGQGITSVAPVAPVAPVVPTKPKADTAVTTNGSGVRNNPSKIAAVPVGISEPDPIVEYLRGTTDQSPVKPPQQKISPSDVQKGKPGSTSETIKLTSNLCVQSGTTTTKNSHSVTIGDGCKIELCEKKSFDCKRAFFSRSEDIFTCESKSGEIFMEDVSDMCDGISIY